MTRRRANNERRAMNNTSEPGSLFKQPSAWIPLVMSLGALMMVLGYAAIFGTIHRRDEAAPARIFQLIMLAQLPIAAYFARQVAAQATRTGTGRPGVAGLWMDHPDCHCDMARESVIVTGKAFLP